MDVSPPCHEADTHDDCYGKGGEENSRANVGVSRFLLAGEANRACLYALWYKQEWQEKQNAGENRLHSDDFQLKYTR